MYSKNNGVTPTSNNANKVEALSNKDIRLIQLKKVFDAYHSQPQTMKECDRNSGIMRESICWYNRHLRQVKQIYCIGKRICSITKHRANVYTTNPNLAPINPQLNLF
jgi:hypothetical protein